MLTPGLYEALITEALESKLEAVDDSELFIQYGTLLPAEVPDRFALHVGRTLIRALSAVKEKDRVSIGGDLIRGLVEEINRRIPDSGVSVDQIVNPAKILTSVLGKRPDGKPLEISHTLTPLLDTALLTNARGEPRLGRQIYSEIESADKIDVIMAFIRMSGIRPFLDVLRKHCEKRVEVPVLRILTTTYTGSTELKALEVLRDLGAEIKVSYDTSTARLHAKAWQFHRNSGANTGYIGSSNITYSAQESGVEWNVRVSGLRNPDITRKMTSMFDAYWDGGDFRTFDSEEFIQETSAVQRTKSSVVLSPVEIRLEPFQERLLEQIEVARRQGRHHNLLVAATGTGKTVMAAVDYSRLRGGMTRSRLLFVAHREEILDQSMATFRHALRESTFGEKWAGGTRPDEFDHVFASIQTLNRAGMSNIDPAYYDVVIIDEFHHAAANSYSKLLSYLQPTELLGLTATPERADGLSILEWFDGRIAAELRLWDAIDQHRLTPFNYYGIHDGLDLSDIPWRRGVGYDTESLSNLYTSNDAWASRVVKEVDSRVDSLSQMKALGFCVSIRHAQFMAQHFQRLGIPAVAIWGDTPEEERKGALRKLSTGEVKIVFSVDLFNEGVDIPSVDTLLLLRPTESATLFLQQIGRGLRKSENKSVCTILDFVGMHRREFRFDKRLSALLGGTRKSVIEQVENSFPYLPVGCHMELDRIASEVVLTSLKSALPDKWRDKVLELKAIIAKCFSADLATFINETGLDLADIYQTKRCWSDFLEAVDLLAFNKGPYEEKLRRGIGRLLHIDDEERLDFYLDKLLQSDEPDLGKFTERDRRMIRMLVASICEQAIERRDSLEIGLKVLWEHPAVLAELRELFALRREQVDHIHLPLDSSGDIPLQIHGKYTRIEIMSGFGLGEFARPRPWREGVLWVEDESIDVFVLTIDKSEGNFSPTTMYRDYAVSPQLIHWESQSNISESSPTGRRYVNHLSNGSKVMLFARQNTSDRAFWFLGPATYVTHQSDRPMAITWQLDIVLPGDLYAQFSAVA